MMDSYNIIKKKNSNYIKFLFEYSFHFTLSLDSLPITYYIWRTLVNLYSIICDKIMNAFLNQVFYVIFYLI